LQERAHAGIAAVTQAASARLQTAKAGKNLLDEDECGVIAAQAVVSKKASIDASDSDRTVARQVELAIGKLDDSVAKLKTASVQHNMEATGHFAKIEAEHKQRLAALWQIAHMLEIPASSVEMSPEELDALAIVQAKAGCAVVMNSTSAGIECVKQKALASVTSVSTPPRQAPVAATPTLLQGLRDTFAMSGQAANGRIETARAGKRLLDDGGEAVVVAKKATLDASDIDKNVAQSVQFAILKLDDSAAKLRGIQSGPEAGDFISRECAAKLADEHELRAKVFRQIAEMLKDPISSLAMNLAEWDAHSFVKAKSGCAVIHGRTSEGFQAVKSFAHSGCMDNESPTGRRMTACA
jgi:hypothetical protein